jgi:hypothetical protein
MVVERRGDWSVGERDIRCALTLVRCGKSISIYRSISGLSLRDFHQQLSHVPFEMESYKEGETHHQPPKSRITPRS